MYLRPNSYLTGVLLGINAIKDAYLWVDSPDCFFMKADHVQGNHDLNSDIRKANGEHRIFPTISDADNVIYDRSSIFKKSLSQLCRRDFTNLIFVTSMPMNQLVGVDYEGLINLVQKDYPDKSVFNIPSKAMTDCWIDGYSDLLLALAKNIDVSGAKPSKKKVAIVGNLFDRYEGDARGNIRELEKIFEGLGLEITSIWLEGSYYNDILKIKDAGTIISLPYGRKAAKKIAERLNAGNLELDLPFGLNKTVEFINSLGNYFDIEKRVVDSFLEKELRINNDVGIIKHAIRDVFLEKRLSYYGDPYLIKGVIDISHSLGLQIKQVFINGHEKHIKNENLSEIFEKTSYCPETQQIDDHIDVFVSSGSNSIPVEENKKVELGFPSYYYHVFTEQPYLGIRGTMNFINRLFNKLVID